MDNNKEIKSNNFLKVIIENDLKNGVIKRLHTRFPPEPNGYLHIGHAKSICLNFGLAKEYNGLCNLRFDDTNPVKEEIEYVESIKRDVKWLGFDWEDRLYYASDYFEICYEYAEKLIKLGKAYVCDLSAEEIKKYRGTLTEPGIESPYRNRTVEENLDLFRRMRNGEFPDGSKTLRAKIDMASPNINMRDPVLYRILRAEHHNTGNKWVIYPMYDYAHPIGDAIENITHSICTLEFEDHRPLYDWVLDTLGINPRPRQYEFARLNMTYTVLSKRKLIELVKNKYVNGWDDPRLPTIAGLRRRGVTPEAIRDFCEKIGVAKANSTVDINFFEHCIREDLNKRANRIMAVLDPVKVIITNYPEDKTETFTIENNPEDPQAGTRELIFSREIYIDRDDFREVPPPKYYRLYPGNEVRLKQAYYIKCERVIKDENGNIKEIHCTYDPLSRGGETPDKRKVKSTIHWLSSKNFVYAEVRLYDRLFIKENPDDYPEGADYKVNLNPESLKIIKNAMIEKCAVNSKPLDKYQFLRIGYFCVDPDSTPEHLIFNKTIGLVDSYAKELQKMNKNQ